MTARTRNARAPARAVYVVGAGRVGLGLARALAARGYRVVGVWNRGAGGRRRGARFLGRPIDGGHLPAAIVEADLVIVAVSDAAVAAAGARLARARLARGVVVAHTAGVLAAAALGRVPGAHLGALHPAVACVDPEQAAAALPRTAFAVEGDVVARRVLTALVRRLGGRPVAVQASRKARYHAALVLASNLVVSLVHLAIQEARAAGFREPQAVAELALGAVTLVTRRGARAALTGPLVRGDRGTVARHLDVLGREARGVYAALSHVGLELARRRGLGRRDARAIAAVLRGR